MTFNRGIEMQVTKDIKVKLIILPLQPTKNESAVYISSLPAQLFHPMNHCCSKVGEG